MSIAERTNSGGELVTVRASQSEMEMIEGIVGECSLDATRDHGHFHRALKLAAGIAAMRKVLTKEMMTDVMALQGTSLGFRTDKDTSGGYQENIVKDCVIECLLKGGHMVGNEMNIISSRAYFTKEFFTRKLRELEGLADLKLCPGVPIFREGKAYVPYTATWVYNGVPGRLERTSHKVGDREVNEMIPVKANTGATDDNVLGKAERKMRKAIYEYLTGSEQMYPDADFDDSHQTLPGPSKLDELTERLTGKPTTIEAASKPVETSASPHLSPIEAACQRFEAAQDMPAVNALMRELKGPTATHHWSDEESDLIETYRVKASERIKHGK